MKDGTWRFPGVRVALAFTLVLAVAVGAQLISPRRAFAQQPFTDLTAKEIADNEVILPPTVGSAQGSATQTGFRNWLTFLGNSSQASVTNPAITVASGYDPSFFPGVAAFPVTYTQPTLAPGQEFSGDLPPSTIPVSFSLGYDSTRTVSPLTIPVGGTQQTVTFTVTPTDSRYAADLSTFDMWVGSDLPGVSVASVTNPGNLNQGETLQTVANQPPPIGLFVWTLGSPQLNKQYTFTVVLNVPNPFGVPFDYRPVVQMDGDTATILCDACAGSSVTIKDPTLDGSVPGSGATTFSVAQTSHTWTSVHEDSATVQYAGTVPAVTQAVNILVKPGAQQPAPVNPKSQGVIPVAILSTSSFDATRVDPVTVKFGATGTEASPKGASFEDVNRDGKLDMVLHFPTQQTGMTCGTTTVTLTGQTNNGQPISGTAPIRTVSCP